ncbi:MAG: GIY-YIG nuclease family protein [Bacteroidia bacterium]|nr:GIY-YIG nuclease family protein [Bacteroidia bacterium]
MVYFVYILRSLKNGSFYKGQTNNLQKRLTEHNSGKEKSTARYAPWELAWACSKTYRSEAVILERKLKNITSKSKIEDFIMRHKNELM